MLDNLEQAAAYVCTASARLRQGGVGGIRNGRACLPVGRAGSRSPLRRRERVPVQVERELVPLLVGVVRAGAKTQSDERTMYFLGLGLPRVRRSLPLRCDGPSRMAGRTMSGLGAGSRAICGVQPAVALLSGKCKTPLPRCFLGPGCLYARSLSLRVVVCPSDALTAEFISIDHRRLTLELRPPNTLEGQPTACHAAPASRSRSATAGSAGFGVLSMYHHCMRCSLRS